MQAYKVWTHGSFHFGPIVICVTNCSYVHYALVLCVYTASPVNSLYVVYNDPAVLHYRCPSNRRLLAIFIT